MSDNISTLNAEANVGVRSVEGIFYNLIPSRFPPVGLYDRLTEDAELRAEFIRIEQLTNPRLRALERMKIDPDKGTKKSRPYQNWNHAPFAYPNPDGSTFFNTHCPVIEMFGDKQTALAVAIARREAFLRSTNEETQGVELRMLKRSVKGAFADAPFEPANVDKAARWEFGKAVTERGLDGIIFNPGDRPFGKGCAVLDNRLLGKAEQCEHYRCIWDGKRIRTIYDFDRSLTIDAASLRLEEKIIG